MKAIYLDWEGPSYTPYTFLRDCGEIGFKLPPLFWGVLYDTGYLFVVNLHHKDVITHFLRDGEIKEISPHEPVVESYLGGDWTQFQSADDWLNWCVVNHLVDGRELGKAKKKLAEAK